MFFSLYIYIKKKCIYPSTKGSYMSVMADILHHASKSFILMGVSCQECVLIRLTNYNHKRKNITIANTKNGQKQSQLQNFAITIFIPIGKNNCTFFKLLQIKIFCNCVRFLRFFDNGFYTLFKNMRI